MYTCIVINHQGTSWLYSRVFELEPCIILQQSTKHFLSKTFENHISFDKSHDDEQTHYKLFYITYLIMLYMYIYHYRQPIFGLKGWQEPWSGLWIWTIIKECVVQALFRCWKHLDQHFLPKILLDKIIAIHCQWAEINQIKQQNCVPFISLHLCGIKMINKYV